MGITLSVLTGGTAGRKHRLANGQSAQFGRTEWADYSFPDDDSMGDVHFAIECTNGKCLLRDLGSESGTFFDGNRIAELQLHSGDEFTAGRTVFLVAIDGQPAVDRIAPRKTATIPEADKPSAPLPPPPRKSLAEICEFVKLDAAVCELAKVQDNDISVFVRILAEDRQYVPALRLMAHQMSHRDAVWWGSLCTRESVGDQLSENDLAALDASVHWVKTGLETDRRKAHEAADATTFDTAAAWIALAASWAEGSLAPVGMPEVAPDERLTGQAITGALLMAAAKAPAGKADQRYQRFLELADEVRSGKTPAPK